MTAAAEEIEAKFLIVDLSVMQSTLIAAGATLKHPRTFERNWRFDTPDHRFARDGMVLRLRQDDRVRLTYKRRLQDPEHRLEVELVVDDAESGRAFLTALGFRLTWIYEKFRETYELQGTEVVLDELPFGQFVEIEGPDLATVRHAAGWLKLEWGRRVAASYGELFLHLRSAKHFAFEDATFENFRQLPSILPSDLGVEDAWEREP